MKLNKEWNPEHKLQDIVQATANLLNLIHQEADAGMDKMKRCYKAIEAIFNED